MQVKNLSIDKLIIGTSITEILNGIKRSINGIYEGLSFFVKKLLKNKGRSESFTGYSERRQGKFNFNSKSSIKIVGVIILTGGLLYGGYKILGYIPLNSSNDGGKIKVQGAKSSQDVYREFLFPLKDENGEELSKIKYSIEKAELKDEIIVKGQKARAVEGRTFLILTVKVINEYRQAVEIETRDYVRLSVNGNEEEWLAAEIHNDPVQVQAISTKFTRLGFAINENDKNLAIRVGEINGDKEKIELNL